jgi:hypothetical protein
MMNISSDSIQLSDQQLLAAIRGTAERERRATARLIALLAELDSRRLYLGEGCSSLFTYCTQILHLSEHAAYGRIEAARAGRRFPILLELFADGSVNLTTVCLIAAHLTADNHRQILDAVRHKSKREVEHFVASLRPQAALPSSVRRLPSMISAEAKAQPLCVEPRGASAATLEAACQPPSPKRQAGHKKRGLGSRWRPLCVRWDERTLHRTGIPRVSPRGAVRCRWGRGGRKHSNFDAERTTPTSPSSTSVRVSRCSCGKWLRELRGTFEARSGPSSRFHTAAAYAPRRWPSIEPQDLRLLVLELP